MLYELSELKPFQITSNSPEITILLMTKPGCACTSQRAPTVFSVNDIKPDMLYYSLDARLEEEADSDKARKLGVDLAGQNNLLRKL